MEAKLAHVCIETNEDGSIRRILKDGIVQTESVVLEQHFGIVTTYFKLSAHNLDMLQTAQTSEERRRYGLQSFLMSITGLEAFVNTYYHQRALELDRQDMLERIKQTHGSVTQKIISLQEMSNDGILFGQDALIDRLWQLSLLRNEIVHPRWEPAQLVMPGISITGLVENRQALFEDLDLCREALLWCILLIARVAEALGADSVEGFVFHWTGRYGMTLEDLLESLGLPTEPKNKAV